MKKLIVFGGSGPTGRQLLDQALDRGHDVTAVIRNPDKLELKHKNLLVVKGDALKLETFSSHVSGKDAVLSAIGATKRGYTTVYSEGAQNIVKAMQSAGVKRLIVLTSSTLGIKQAEGVSWFMKWLVGTVLHGLLKDSYDDMQRMEDFLKTVDLNWTIVRPGKLTNAAKTGKYRTSLNKNAISGYSLPRADLAHYMLSIIDDQKTFKGTVLINS